MIPNFIGLDQFVWFIGVVESREDPEKLGRVQVRIFGHHTENKENIPTEDLHWAWCLTPVSSAGINGIGDFSLGLVEGSWVVGFFKDSLNCQEPVIFGTFGGGYSKGDYPYPKNKKTGFLDPGKNISERPRKVEERIYKTDGQGIELKNEKRTPETDLYPRKKHPYGCVIQENDVNRLARNEKIEDTIIFIKRNNLDKMVKAADGSFWSEPSTPYNAVYPYNKVKESESGHIFEIDDTKKFERLHIWHRSGTFMEIYPAGTKVEKIVHSSFSVIMAEKYEHVMNRYNLTVDGPYNLMVFNNSNITVTGSCTIRVGGQAKIISGQTLELNAETVKINARSNITLQSGMNIQLKSMNVSSNPAINQAKESLKAGGLGVVIPVTPAPGQPDISVETEVKQRSYPVPVPEFVE